MERSKFFDDLAGVAGGAMSALSGLRDEAESTVRARVEEMIRKLDLVRREELEAVQEIAARARAGQEALETRVAVLEAALASAEGARVASAGAGGASSSAASGSAASGIADLGSAGSSSAASGSSAAAAVGEPSMPPPTDSAEPPRPDLPDLRAPKSAS